MRSAQSDASAADCPARRSRTACLVWSVKRDSAISATRRWPKSNHTASGWSGVVTRVLASRRPRTIEIGWRQCTTQISWHTLHCLRSVAWRTEEPDAIAASGFSVPRPHAAPHLPCLLRETGEVPASHAAHLRPHPIPCWRNPLHAPHLPTIPTQDPMDLAARLAERHRLDGDAGRGGMPVVYRAHDLRHDRDVARKVLRPELAASLGADRFLREVGFAARLQHPHILPLLDSGELPAVPGVSPQVLWYAMPLVEGESLRDRLRRGGAQPLADVLRWAAELADALAYAHGHGVIHRDIKPENVLLSGQHVLLADFGVARALETGADDRLTETGLALGTPAYMSPEQALADNTLDGRADLYSLGCVLYELLTGEPPYTGPTVQNIIAKRL